MKQRISCGICGQLAQMPGTQRCDACWEIEHRIKSEVGREVAFKILGPIDMVLFCPMCNTQHIDEDESVVCPWCGDRAAEGDTNRPATTCSHQPVWTNPPHKSHQCRACGFVWRPADVPTNGVASIKTRGKNDTQPPHPQDWPTTS